MTAPGNGLEEALRRGLAEAVGRIEPSADGLERIHARIGGRPPRPWLLNCRRRHPRRGQALGLARALVLAMELGWADRTTRGGRRRAAPGAVVVAPGASVVVAPATAAAAPGRAAQARPGPVPAHRSRGRRRLAAADRRAGRDRAHRQRLVRRAALPAGDHPGEQHRAERRRRPRARRRGTDGSGSQTTNGTGSPVRARPRPGHTGRPGARRNLVQRCGLSEPDHVQRPARQPSRRT